MDSYVKVIGQHTRKSLVVLQHFVVSLNLNIMNYVFRVCLSWVFIYILPQALYQLQVLLSDQIRRISDEQELSKFINSVQLQLIVYMTPEILSSCKYAHIGYRPWLSSSASTLCKLFCPNDARILRALARSITSIILQSNTALMISCWTNVNVGSITLGLKKTRQNLQPYYLMCI